MRLLAPDNRALQCLEGLPVDHALASFESLHCAIRVVALDIAIDLLRHIALGPVLPQFNRARLIDDALIDKTLDHISRILDRRQPCLFVKRASGNIMEGIERGDGSGKPCRVALSASKAIHFTKPALDIDV